MRMSKTLHHTAALLVHVCHSLLLADTMLVKTARIQQKVETQFQIASAQKPTILRCVSCTFSLV